MKRPVYVQGSSVGAINGASYVENGCNAEEMEKTWLETVEKAGPSLIFNRRSIPRNIVTLKNYLFSDTGLQNLVRRIDVGALVRSDTEFRSVVRNNSKNKKEILSNHRREFCKNPELLRKIILASASVASFPLVRIGRYNYSDGLIFDIQDALDFGCDIVLVFLNEPARHSSELIMKRVWFRMISEGHDVYDEFVESELKRFSESKEFRNKVIVVRAGGKVLVDHFRDGDISEAIEEGYRIGIDVLGKASLHKAKNPGSFLLPAGMPVRTVLAWQGP